MATTVLVAAAALWLFSPGAASGGSSHYEGDFDPSGTLQFDVTGSGNKRKVANFKFDSFPLTCIGFESHTQTSELNFSPRIGKDRRFKARALKGDNPFEPEAELTLKGRFSAGFGQASGTMRIEGAQVEIDEGGTANCDSGQVPWSAAR